MRDTRFKHMAMSRRLSLLAIGAWLLAACSDGQPPAADVGVERLPIEVWVHADADNERRVLRDQIRRFNETQDRITVTLRILPDDVYQPQIDAAARANQLPDIVEFDGPDVYHYAARNQLMPIDKLLPEWVSEDLLRSVLDQGRYDGRLYSIATHDAGIGLWANRAALQRAGVRVPAGIDTAWTSVEFRDVLLRLAAHDDDGAVLDLKLNYGGDWYAFGIAPAVSSAGGDLIDRSTYRSADGMLNGAAAVTALREVQDWIRSGRVDANADDRAFIDGRVALSWTGHWEYPRYRERYGDDLVLLPLPDFGQGSRTGSGSWCWGITRYSRHPQAAMQLLTFLMRPEEIAAVTAVNGAVPATHSALAQSPEYRHDGALRLFAEQLDKVAVARPKTPGYAAISAAFHDAFEEIRDGDDVQHALDGAVAAIERSIAAYAAADAPSGN